MELEAARDKAARCAGYLAGAVGGHKEALFPEARELLDKLAAKSPFRWPEDVVGPILEREREYWPGEWSDG
ncbi:MAG: hypothetical protein LBC97_05200 [Bifidobacteriaceae bacterium]|nr:hypothetical protein [Bifidobacteriaceae bacterium]